MLYLPKTRPSVAPIQEIPHVSLADLPENVSATALLPRYTGSGEAQQLKTDDLPAIHVSLPTQFPATRSARLTPTQLFTPRPRCFTSGEPIPLAIGIRCLSSPALAKLYASSVSIQLVKKRRIWVTGGRQISIRETQLASAVPIGRIECNDGEGFLSFRLEAGAAGRESSWAVEGALEVSVMLFKLARTAGG